MNFKPDYYTKTVPFVKMHGDGNDFVIIDNRNNEYKLTKDDYKMIADRRLGIGCDQVVTLNKSKVADCLMLINNTDGSKAETCGNAARCVADFLISEKKLQNTKMEITGRVVSASRPKPKMIKLNMGKALTKWNEIPLSKAYDTLSLPIAIGVLSNPVAVNIGNPHVVFFVTELTGDQLFEELARKIAKHELFENGVNISVARVDNRKTISAKIWERGVGLTRSCGSASCAIFSAATRRGYIKNGKKVTINFPGGALLVESDENEEIHITGSICYVFDGTMYK